MSNFVIHGGKKLKGEITTFTAKNAALYCMYACLLTREESILTDMPRIEEVERTREVFTSIGIQTKWIDDNTLQITPPAKIQMEKINYQAAAKTRVVLFLMGTLIHTFKSFNIPRSGGCKLGSRTIFPHTLALQNFGTKITTTPKYYKVEQKTSVKGAEIVMYEAGDTATANAILAGVLAEGKTTITFASANYMVSDMCYLLNSMGAKITGIGTTTLNITGVKTLKGAKQYPIIPDPIESMLLLSIAATTNSSITIRNCPKAFLGIELLKLREMGFNFKILKQYKSKNKHFDIIDIQTLPSQLKALEMPDKIEPRPYPGLNIDNLPFFVPIATQAKGTTLIHDWVYENRAIYYLELQKLGADIILADPHRVLVRGKIAFKPTEVVCPPALRPASIILIAMLAASGKSILRNTYSIDRGYENLYNRLKQLGAEIETLN